DLPYPGGAHHVSDTDRGPTCSVDKREVPRAHACRRTSRPFPRLFLPVPATASGRVPPRSSPAAKGELFHADLALGVSSAAPLSARTFSIAVRHCGLSRISSASRGSPRNVKGVGVVSWKRGSGFDSAKL
ncbi:hypothetical protein U9M48_011776, partial [Paspalum notatum var. saurae]